MKNRENLFLRQGRATGFSKRLFACLLLGSLTLGNAMAQNIKRITLQLKNAQLEKVLSTIKEQTGMRLIYSDEDIANIPPVNINVKDMEVLEAVKQCLKNTGLSATIKDNTIVISPTTQAGEIKGIVTDERNGEPMIGVNVSVIKGGKMITGVVTDIDGKFSVNIPRGAQLKFSFVGYSEQVISPEGNDIKVALKEDANTMDEVVVNGFFTRSKQTYTGAARTVTSEQLLSISPNNVLQALSVLDPSIKINKNNAMGSNPNNIPDLVIRSTTSLATDNEAGLNAPLIVIDGVESTLQDLYDINMYDIERVDILKDASATALYGENAANGVIVIERKRVEQAPVRIRYTFTPDFSFADLSSYDLCNSQQKLELERLAGLYDSSNGSMDNTYYEKLALVSSGINTDWKSKPIRTGFSQTHSLSVSGRGGSIEYNITGNFTDKNGVMKDDGRKNYGLELYLAYRLKEKLVLTLRASHQQTNIRNSKYGSYDTWLQMNPYDSPYDENGELRSLLSWDMTNPLYEASLSSFSTEETRTQNLSLSARYNFKPNLYITAQGSLLTAKGTADDFVSPLSMQFKDVTDPLKKGSYTLTNNDEDNYSFKVVGNWIHSFDNDGTLFTLNVGGEIKKENSSSRTSIASGFLSDNLTDFGYAASYSDTTPYGSEDLATSVGAFAAANFTWKNRYIIDGSYRMSGSSKFGENNKYAPFWSVGAGYNLHNEEFIKQLGWVDMLRLRGSYGYTGSVKFSPYQAISTYKYYISNIHLGGVGAVPMAMPNPDLTWQTTKKLNVGITSSFFDERLNVNCDYYNEYTDDMLIDISLPPSSGASTVKDNYGAQESNGIEFAVWGKPIVTKDFSWTVSVNGLHSKTVIKNISEALQRKNDENNAVSDESVPRILYEEGGSPTAIYAVRSAGIDPASGKEIYIKKDGTYTYTYDVKDKVVVGDTNPDVEGNFSTDFMYKNFYLGVNFSYTFGGDIYNSTRAAKIENINPQYNADVRAFTERWKQPGDLVPYLNLSATGGQQFVHSSRFVENENEIWLSSINFAYEFPQSLIQSWGIQRLRLTLGASDLFRLSTVRYERGTSYPYSRSINMSFNITL